MSRLPSCPMQGYNSADLHGYVLFEQGLAQGTWGFLPFWLGFVDPMFMHEHRIHKSHKSHRIHKSHICVLVERGYHWICGACDILFGICGSYVHVYWLSGVSTGYVGPVAFCLGFVDPKFMCTV